METLRLEHVSKVYKAKKRKEQDVQAVTDFNLTAEDDEFIVFVGPSGCGKSTTLRMIAGLEDISDGNLYIDGERVNDVEANYRDIAMVFQNYALYPHMTAYQNMAFGLKNRHVPKEEIDKRIHNAAKILDIEELLDRKPGKMSGGQRQRVALGRAIVRRPKVFLLDEPLSNLDAKLRATMRVEISRLYEQLKTTFIYVTHDQVEAMTMGTRIVVMKKGVVQQIDTPTNLFDYPKNRFVAGFLGTPQMNFYEGEGRRDNDVFRFTMHGEELSFPLSQMKEMKKEVLDGEVHSMILGIRPDDIVIEGENKSLSTRVTISEVLGNETLLYTDFKDGDANQESLTSLVIKTAKRTDYRRGDVLFVYFPAEKVHFFENDNDAERSLMVTPRARLSEMKGYLDLEKDTPRIAFENGLAFQLEHLDKSKVNPHYLTGVHRVRMVIPEDAFRVATDGIQAIYEGEGMYQGKRMMRLELNPNLSYEESWNSPTTHLYLPYEEGHQIGDVLSLVIDESRLDFIGDDHLSVYDQNEKEKELESYRIVED